MKDSDTDISAQTLWSSLRSSLALRSFSLYGMYGDIIDLGEFKSEYQILYLLRPELINRCLIPTRQDWFRSVMCYLMLLSMTCFFVFGIIQTFVTYDQVRLPLPRA